MSINFRDGKWSELSMTFSWPHQAFLFGWNAVEATKEEPSHCISIHLGPIAFMYEWGDENWNWDE